MDKIDFKKRDKALYQPKTTPTLIDVPPLLFIQVEGKGNPNTPGGEFSQAVELLYNLSYSIKMWPKSGKVIPDYYDYVVAPLEGLWWLTEYQDFDPANIDKNKFQFITMIRQPEFVTLDLFEQVKIAVKKKKPNIDIDKAKLVEFNEGLCVQCMHIGPFDDEPQTVAKMDAFVAVNDLIKDLSDTRNHHEIYISDMRKTAPGKLKTVLRLPVKAKEC